MAHTESVKTATAEICGSYLPALWIEDMILWLVFLERHIRGQRSVIPTMQIIVTLKPILDLSAREKHCPVRPRPVSACLLAHFRDKRFRIRSKRRRTRRCGRRHARRNGAQE